MDLSLPEGWREESSRVALLRTTDRKVLVLEQPNLWVIILQKPRVTRLKELLKSTQTASILPRAAESWMSLKQEDRERGGGKGVTKTEPW